MQVVAVMEWLPHSRCSPTGLALPALQGKPPKKPKPAANGDAKPKKRPKDAAEGEGAADGKKKRKKKDKNAPKGPLSAFMYFSQAMRDQVGDPGLCSMRMCM